MSGCDALAGLLATLWPLPVTYLLGLALSSYLLPLVRPRDWSGEATPLAAWFWPLGIWFLLQARAYQAGQDARYRLQDEKHALAVVERTRQPSSTYDDHSYWNEYTDHARGMVVRWREVSR